MDITEDKENSCMNCGYYLRHYVNSHGMFMPVNNGHCSSGKMRFTESDKIIKKRGKCEFWIPREEQAKRRRENIEEVIRHLAKTLDEFVQILKLENGDNIRSEK